ncbi:MAG: hypothetical protein LBJ90_04565 [Treponema sp.]|jgi:hypothetical protein|nr:hypothetical protein [Treponema sp.]
MKRIVLCVFFAAALSGALLAQDSSRPGSPRRNWPPEKIALSGSLGLSLGRIVLENGGNTYYVAGIDRLIGFIEGLKEGAAVSLEGWAFPLRRSETEWIFRAAKLSINGKDYELGSEEGPAFHHGGFGRGKGSGSGYRPRHFNRAPGFGPPNRNPWQSGPGGGRGRR